MEYASGEKGDPGGLGHWGRQSPEQLSNLNCCATLSQSIADNRLY